MHEKKYSEVATLIQAALRHGQVESWMYEAIALAIRSDAVNGGKSLDSTREELERALLSAVDFAETEDQMVMLAAYMAQAGLEPRALKLYEQIGNANPSRAEPFLQGLAIAQRLDDMSAIQWACAGILSHEWSGEQRALGEKAYRVAEATYRRLIEEGRK